MFGDRIIFCFSWLPCFPRQEGLRVGSLMPQPSSLSILGVTRPDFSIPLSRTEAPSALEISQANATDKAARELYDACWDGDLAGCIDLLQKGANPNVHFGPRRSTALHTAVKLRNPNVSHTTDIYTSIILDGFRSHAIQRESNNEGL